MRTTGLVLALVVGLGLDLLAVLPVPAAEKTTAEQVARLIEQLGSPTFGDREQASRLLDEIGLPALAALRKAAESNDAEVRRRAEELVKKIEKRGENAQLLAPTRLQLVCQDTPVAEAVALLAKKSGYDISLHDPEKKLADRKVTVDTGNVSFWEAFDKLCAAASLVEAAPQDTIQRVQPRRPLPQRPLPLPAPAAPPAQAQPAQAQPAQFQAVAVVVGPGIPQVTSARIILKDGKPSALPTDYAGAVRIQALPRGLPQLRAHEFPFGVLLQVSPEPKLRWQNLIAVRVDKAVDDRGQNLQALADEKPADPNVPLGRAAVAFTAVMTFHRPGVHVQVPIRLNKGNQEAKSLKELEGVISAQVWGTPQAMIQVDDVLKAAGQTVKGADGGFLKVVEAKREANGQIKVRLEMEAPPNVLPAGQPAGFGSDVIPLQLILPANVPPAPVPPALAPRNGLQFQPAQPLPPAQPVQVQVQIQFAPGMRVAPGFGGASGLALVDEKGQHVKPTNVEQQLRPNGNALTVEHVLTFPAPKGEKASLVFSGSRSTSVDIPFKLKDVPLP